MALKVYYSKIYDTIKPSELGLLEDIWRSYDPNKAKGDYVLLAGAHFMFASPVQYNKKEKRMLECDAVLLTPHGVILIEMKKFSGPFMLEESGSGSQVVVKISRDGEFKEFLNAADPNAAANSFNHGAEQLKERIFFVFEARKDNNKWFANVDRWPRECVKGLLMFGTEGTKNAGWEEITDRRYTFIKGGQRSSGTHGLIYPISNTTTFIREIIDQQPGREFETDFWSRVSEIDRAIARDNNDFFGGDKKEERRKQIIDMYLRHAYDHIVFDVIVQPGRNRCNEASERALNEFKKSLSKDTKQSDNRGNTPVRKDPAPRSHTPAPRATNSNYSSRTTAYQNNWRREEEDNGCSFGCVLGGLIIIAVIYLIFHFGPYYWNKPSDMSADLKETYDAASNGDAQACLDISEALRTGVGVKRDLKGALKWLRNAESHGSGKAYEKHADYFRQGLLVDRKSPEEAVRYYQYAASHGNIAALNKVAPTLSEVNLLDKYRNSLNKSDVWGRSEESYSSERDYNLATTYVVSSPSKAYELMYKSADMRHCPAIYWMWHYYTKVNPNMAQAREWARLYTLHPAAEKEPLAEIEQFLQTINDEENSIFNFSDSY